MYARANRLTSRDSKQESAALRQEEEEEEEEEEATGNSWSERVGELSGSPAGRLHP